MPYLTKCKPPKQRYNNTIAERKRVYNTTLWRKLRQSKLMTNPICEVCKTNTAEDVHHIKTFVNQNNWQDLAFDFNNLISVCRLCHNDIHNNKITL